MEPVDKVPDGEMEMVTECTAAETGYGISHFLAPLPWRFDVTRVGDDLYIDLRSNADRASHEHGHRESL